MRRLVLLPALLAILVGAPPALAWTWPVDGPVLQPFALGDDPYAAGQHRGIDVGSTEGVPVRAPAPGAVTFAGTVPGGGRSITIETSDGLAVTLLHLGAVLVARGDTVAEGAHVGAAGWSGEAEHAVPSVHLGVRIAAQPTGYLDPLSLLPPPATVVADPEPTEPADPADPPDPAATPVAGTDGDEPTAPAVEVTTLAPEPEGAGLVPVSQQQDAHPDLAEPMVTEVPLLEPLTLAPVESAEPPEASAASASAATHEPSGAPPAEPAAVSPGAEATSAPPVPSPDDAIGSARSSLPSTASTPVDRPDARRGGPRARADRPVPMGRSHRVRLDRRAEPFAEASPEPVRSGARAIEPEASRLPRVARQPGEGAVAVPESSGEAWIPYGALATVVAALAVVLVMRRGGRGDQETAGREAPPSAPPLDAAQGAEPGTGVAPVTPPPWRDPPRFRRRLDRGGPGGSAKRPAAGVRGRRASV